MTRVLIRELIISDGLKSGESFVLSETVDGDTVVLTYKDVDREELSTLNILQYVIEVVPIDDNKFRLMLAIPERRLIRFQMNDVSQELLRVISNIVLKKGDTVFAELGRGKPYVSPDGEFFEDLYCDLRDRSEAERMRFTRKWKEGFTLSKAMFDENIRVFLEEYFEQDSLIVSKLMEVCGELDLDFEVDFRFDRPNFDARLFNYILSSDLMMKCYDLRMSNEECMLFVGTLVNYILLLLKSHLKLFFDSFEGEPIFV